MNIRSWLASAGTFVLLLASACTGGVDTPSPTATASLTPSPSLTSPSPSGQQAPTPLAVIERVTAQPTPTAAVANPVGNGEAQRIVAAEEEVLNRIFEAVAPSVVHITVAQRSPLSDVGPFGFGQQRQGGVQPTGEGSGFVWDRSGNIVTNNHVVAGADVVSVKFYDGTEVVADVVGADPFSDLAVVRVDVPSDRFRPVTLGDSGQLKVGQMAVAIGHPFGKSFTLTSGIVSAVGRLIPSGSTPFQIPEAVQTDAAINPGNSGGPLLDREARVIGINAQIETTSGSNVGIGFAIPVNIAKIVVPALIRDGTYDYAYLGVSLQTVTQEIARLLGLPESTRGALIVGASQGEPADRSGLRGGSSSRVVTTATGQDIRAGGDVIIRVGDTPVRSSDDLIAYTALQARPGDTVPVTVIRSGREQTVNVTFGTRPS